MAPLLGDELLSHPAPGLDLVRMVEVYPKNRPSAHAAAGCASIMAYFSQIVTFPYTNCLLAILSRWPMIRANRFKSS